MDVIRVFISVALFSSSSYLAYDLFTNGFNWMVLAVCISGYFLVHYVWPKHKIEDSAWYEALDLVLELPYRCVAMIIRFLSKLAKNSDGGFGLD